MKTTFYFVLSLLFFSNVLVAQEKITVKVKGDTEYEKILPQSMMYEYPDFREGKLYYVSGSVSANQFNYSLVAKALLFKDKSGKVLEFAFPDQIKMVMIDNRYWRPVEGGLGQIIYSRDSLELIRYRETVCTDIRKEGAFGGVSNTSSVTNISSIIGNGGSSRQALTVKGEYDFEVKATYYLRLGDAMEVADVKGFTKLFPGLKSEIKNIVKSKKLNLGKEVDIIELIKSLTFK